MFIFYSCVMHTCKCDEVDGCIYSHWVYRCIYIETKSYACMSYFRIISRLHLPAVVNAVVLPITFSILVNILATYARSGKLITCRLCKRVDKESSAHSVTGCTLTLRPTRAYKDFTSRDARVNGPRNKSMSNQSNWEYRSRLYKSIFFMPSFNRPAEDNSGKCGSKYVSMTQNLSCPFHMHQDYEIPVPYVSRTRLVYIHCNMLFSPSGS